MPACARELLKQRARVYTHMYACIMFSVYMCVCVCVCVCVWCCVYVCVCVWGGGWEEAHW